jgi:hypothetical protein
MVVAIPPSSGTRAHIKQATQQASRRKSSNRRRGLGSSWLLLNGVCLTLNIGLMVTLFIFQTQWMPTPKGNLVLRDHFKTRKEFWKLLRKQKNNYQQGLAWGEGEAQLEAEAEAEAEAEEEEREAEAEAEAEEEEREAEDAEEETAEKNSKAEEKAKTNHKPKSDKTKKNNSPNSDNYDLSQQQYHVIFSTGCSDKQHWQSYMLYHSILTSGQLGQVTRIASGCNETEAKQLQQIHQEQIEPMGGSNGRFHLHLTPEFGSGFHYNNKPYGVAHWMEHVLGYHQDHSPQVAEHDDTILLLLDPDMVFMRPFVNDFTKHEMWRPRTSYPLVDRVKHGYPMASEYGYGNQWFHKTKIAQIKGFEQSPVPNLTKADIDENYHAGPPVRVANVLVGMK